MVQGGDPALHLRLPDLRGNHAASDGHTDTTTGSPVVSLTAQGRPQLANIPGDAAIILNLVSAKALDRAPFAEVVNCLQIELTMLAERQGDLLVELLDTVVDFALRAAHAVAVGEKLIGDVERGHDGNAI